MSPAAGCGRGGASGADTPRLPWPEQHGPAAMGTAPGEPPGIAGSGSEVPQSPPVALREPAVKHAQPKSVPR